jgi:hypothetical protein
MRPTCLDCAGKHLAQACVLLKETKTGYPAFKWFVIGHLAEAEEETVLLYPDLANEIREHRVAWSNDDTVLIPFEELLAKIDDLLESDEQSAMDDASEAKHAAPLGTAGTELSPVGAFDQTGESPGAGMTGENGGDF